MNKLLNMLSLRLLLAAGGLLSLGLSAAQAQSTFSVSGNVRRNSGPAVPGATVAMSGTATGSDLTNSAGNYLLPNLAAGSNLTLTPTKSTDFKECVSVRDMLFISKHILGLQPLGSPYQMIAADVNKSGTITTFDINQVRDLILGKIPQFPNSDSWRFVPADFVFPNPLNPFTSVFPENGSVTNLQANATRDFIGMKIRDATDCVGDAHAPAFLTLTAPNLTANVGSNINVVVTSQGFSDVSGLQFTLSWNPAVLQFNGVNSPLPSWSSPAYYANGGNLSVCWGNSTPQALPDGSAVFTLQFTVIGAGGTSSLLTFTENPTRSEVVNGACNPFDLTRVNGSVTVTAPPCPLICNDQVSVSVDASCEAVIGPDAILEGTGNCSTSTFLLTVRDNANNLLLSGVNPAILDLTMNGPLTVSVTDPATGNKCFSIVTIADKLPPICVAPPNVVTDCEHFDRSLGLYGTATATDNCCLTGITETSTGDILCTGGTILRRFRADDCHGNISTCTQTIVVQPVGSAGFYVRFPDDVVSNNCSATYPQPVIEALGCSQVGMSYTDELFTVVPDACFKIERTWTVIDLCIYDPNVPVIQIPNPRPNASLNHPDNLPGPTVSAMGTASPWSPTVSALVPGGPLVDFSTFWSSAPAGGYQYKQTIKVIDTAPPVIDQSFGPNNVCDLTDNDPDLWSGSGWLDPVSGTNNLEEAVAPLIIVVEDNCLNVNIRYLLFLDLDQDGTMETVVNSQNLPGFNNVNFNNAANPGYSGGTPRPFDSRPVAAADKYGFALNVGAVGAGFGAAVRWNTQATPDNYTDPQLPHGTHKIRWTVEDGCGNEAVYEKTFTVKDSVALGPSPCDSIATTFTQTSSSPTCCAAIQVNNLTPGYFSAVKVSVISGGSLLLSDVTPKPGWIVGGFQNGTSVTLKPTAGGFFPAGNLDLASICMSNLTATDQYLEVTYIASDTICRDTLHFICDYCIAITSDSIGCDSAGVRKIRFCVSVSPNLGYPINSIVLMPPTGVSISPLTFSLPNVQPGSQHCYLTAYVVLPSGTPPNSLCIGFTAHEQDVTKGLPPLRCCMVKECLTLPDCLCDPDVTYATATAAQFGGKDCCWDITLHQPPGVILSVQTNILTPGVTYEAVAGSGVWDFAIRSPQSFGWTLNAGGTLPASIALPTLCLAVPIGSPSPQLLEIVWFAADGTICRQVLEFNCRAKDPCITVDAAQAVCTGTGGTINLSITVTNTSNPPATGGEVVLTPIGPAPFTLAPANFIVSLAPGASTTLSTTATGVTSSELWFLVHLHETAGDTSHLTCCVAEDTLKVEITDNKNPTVVCASGLSVNLTLGGSVLVSATDLVLYAEDDCSPPAQIQYAVRIADTGTGFPAGQSNVTFTCADLGFQTVEVWAIDAAGNADYCETFVIVQDNNGLCGNDPAAFYLYQNLPNPWSESTQIGFRLPAESEATLRVFDAMGRTLYTQSAFFKKERTASA